MNRWLTGKRSGRSVCCWTAGSIPEAGDTIFCGSVGRTDLPGGDYGQLLESIQKNILTLPDDLTVYPGHGGETTVIFEKKNNPYLIQE